MGCPKIGQPLTGQVGAHLGRAAGAPLRNPKIITEDPAPTQGLLFINEGTYVTLFECYISRHASFQEQFVIRDIDLDCIDRCFTSGDGLYVPRSELRFV